MSFQACTWALKQPAKESCIFCKASFVIETDYHDMGVCGDCTKLLAHHYVMAHSGAPDDRFSTEYQIEQYRQITSKSTRKFKDKIPQRLRTQVFERDAYRCITCGSYLGLHADHVIPESHGGPTTLENLQTLCSKCNLLKGNKMPEGCAV